MCWWFRWMLNNPFDHCLHILAAILQSHIGRVFRVHVSSYLPQQVMQFPPFISSHPRKHIRSFPDDGYTWTDERTSGYTPVNTNTVEVKEKENEDVYLPTLQLKCDQLEEEKRELKIQRDDAVRRLSEVMSSKLRDNNPNIVDLSDEFRPTKLAEMSSELYDNEWTEAFTVIEEKLRQIDGGISEKRIIQILLDIFMVVYRVGKATSEREWKTLVTSVMGSTESVSIEDIKYLKDLRKKYALGRLQEAQKTCLEKLRQSLQLERSLFGEERFLAYIKGCVKLCWLAQCQDPPVVFVCPGVKSVGDNPNDGLAGNSNFGPERNTTPASLADNPNDCLAVSSNFSQERITAPDYLGDNQIDNIPVGDTLDASPEREIASVAFDDNQNDSVQFPDTLDVSPERFDDSGSVEMDEWCSDESPANQFGEKGRDIGQMKAGANETKTGIEFDKGLRNKFERNEQNEGESVPTKQGTKAGNLDEDRAAFNKSLYREYTKSGGYIEYVVWPVMLLHEAGPILAKGVAQGCD